ncbi:MAG: c-type cytochrome biogenesis protein CcmI [Methylocystaceae bacterium]|nr:c-type cytochrome biogenesis protein CcmI [Methylocystaceae bacterium]
MTFWIAVVLLCGATLFILATPLWRKNKEQAERAEFEMNVFKDQLKELDRDLERGLINAQEAETARIEIQRRLLHADEMRGQNTSTQTGLTKSTILFSLIGALVIVAGSLLVYAKVGMPGYADMPYAGRNFDSEKKVAFNEDMNRAIAMLKKRLESNPTDVDAWILLGRTMRTMERMDDAIKAYKNAVKFSNRHPAILADYAETQIYADKGEVTQEARKALQEAVESDPMQLKARFYLGYAKSRAEDFEGALQDWTDLSAMSPPDAPWLAQIKEQMQMAAKAGDLDLADFKPSKQALALGKQIALEWEKEQADQATAPGPTREQMQDAQEMSAEDRSDMIRSMVNRLAERLKDEPNDLAGWKRLANAYQVLGETEKAQEAFAKIKELEAQ